jgi:hypothetical protein
MVDGNRLGFLPRRHHKYQWKIYSKKVFEDLEVQSTSDPTYSEVESSLFQSESFTTIPTSVAIDFFKNKLRGQNRKVGTTKKSDEAVLL